eukprot:scaffold21207_cov124-Isochrysis_galbana.AAC.3
MTHESFQLYHRTFRQCRTHPRTGVAQSANENERTEHTAHLLLILIRTRYYMLHAAICYLSDYLWQPSIDRGHL